MSQFEGAVHFSLYLSLHISLKCAWAVSHPLHSPERIPLAALTQHQISDLMGSQKKFGFSKFSLFFASSNTKYIVTSD